MKNKAITYEQCNEALKATKVAVWQQDMSNNNIFVSKNWEEVTGYNINKFKSLIEFIEETAIYEDKISALNDLSLCIEGKINFYHSIYRMMTEDNEVKWFLLNGSCLRGSKKEVKSLSGLILDITEQKNKENEIKKIAYYDTVTGIPNRNAFFNELKNSLQGLGLNDVRGAIILLNIDNFKLINDTFGYDNGDLLLKVFSQLLSLCIKDYGKLFKLAGDEFVILIGDYKEENSLLNLCDMLMEYSTKPFEVNEHKMYITTSMGISIFPKHSSNIKDLLKYADLALLKSKIEGKNKYTFFENSIGQSYFRRIIIEQELKNSIKNNELSIVYQPQIEALENKVIGLEALLRWNNKELGVVTPSEFIPIAERTGMIIEIGDWVLNRVCKKVNKIKKKYYNLKSISINISPIQIRESNFKEKIINICRKNGVNVNMIELEITEGALMELNIEKIKDLNELIKEGISISIDDFGIGYSSLNYLTVLPVNTLKIDKSFIDNIKNEKNRAVIECIMNLSKSLKYEVIAEGVETKEQLDLIMKLGCKRIQGYYFSKPITEEELQITIIRM